MITGKEKMEPKRLKILGEHEIKTIFGKPDFTEEERYFFFSLSQPENVLMESFRSIKSKTYFILQLGYFKDKHQFFKLDYSDITADLEHILNHYFNVRIEERNLGLLSNKTILKQQQSIRELFGFQSCGIEERQQLIQKSYKAVTFCSKPIFIFKELIKFLANEQIVIPGYNILQDIVGKSIVYEQNRLISLMKKHLTTDNIAALSQLLENSHGLYEITQLKRQPKDFSFKEIKREIDRGTQIQALYQFARNLLPKLEISNESIKYYASLVDYYSVFRLKQLDEWNSYIYLLCYIYYRFQRVNDNLINTFIYSIRRYKNEAKATAKDQAYERYTENNANIEKAGKVLKLFIDDSIPPSTPFRELQNQVFTILDRNHLEILADQIVTNTRVDETALQWEHIDKMAHRFKRYLRPIFFMVEFVCPSAVPNPLVEAIQFLKEAFTKNKSLSQYPMYKLPTQFIPDKLKNYIYQSSLSKPKELIVDRYEFLIYQLLWNRLEAGAIFCYDSTRFRSFEEYLINDAQWEQKEQLMIDTGISTFTQPVQQHLAELENLLETRIKVINDHIESGENRFIQIKKNKHQRRWSLQNDRKEEPAINHPFFDQLRPIEIGQVLHYVNQSCQFLEAFEHVLDRYAKQTKDNHVLTACLIAWGTNMGLGRMGEISDIDYTSLSVTSDNFIRLETLKQANDSVSDATAKLPIFGHYNINNIIHSSSDGQKFETGIHTINSRYSSKYFGFKKGVVSYSTVANHVPVNARIIGANEHESHYVFDSLYSNSTDIQPDIHSTDTHGSNEVNFAILHFFDYQFAPRYKDIYDTIRTSLYGFKHPSHYEKMTIKPIRKLNTNLIITEWDNIQRIIISLSQKTTTQSIIVGKLSAYARKNKTKQALWEYDNIIKSLYFLDYIDSLSLRQNVHQALNRGESYHKLRRAVSYANFGKLRFKTEQDQQIWGECARLLTNCIIYYNTSVLSNMLTYCETEGLDYKQLVRASPVAWQHINFYGHYEFNNPATPLDIKQIIQDLIQLSTFNTQPDA